MSLTPDDLRELLAAFEGSTWQEMTVSVGGDSLHVSRRGTVASAETPAAPAVPATEAPSPAAAPPVHTAPVATEPARPAPTHVPPDDAVGRDTGTPVLAPSVGLFWRAPSPGAPPFVEVGTRVAPDDVIGIVEVMKLMNQVTAGTAGVVTAVLVENGGMVEHGQPLVLVDPTA